MKNDGLFLLIVGVLWLLMLSACHSLPQVEKPTTVKPSTPTNFDVAAIDRWLTSEVEVRGLVGLSVAIVRDKEIVLAKGYGTRSAGMQEPVDSKTPFAIGSISKEFTCAAAMTLVDESKLSMQDQVARYYPQLTRATDITLDDLAAHVSGYTDYYPLDFTDSRSKTPIAPDDLLTRYAGQPLDFEPRSRWGYSNTGFVLLGRIVERVAATSLSDLLTQRIFKPLGMTQTTLGRPTTEAEPATGHIAFELGEPEKSEPEKAGWLFGAGEIWSSVDDLARWDIGFMEGKILSETTRRYMMTPHTTTDGRGTNYGCGLIVREQDGEIVIEHSGEVQGFLAFNSFIPRTKSAVILLSNHMQNDPSDIQATLLQLVLDDTMRLPIIKGPSAAEAASDLIQQLQRGAVNRKNLGPELNEYFDELHVTQAAPRLRDLGEPAVTVLRQWERSGMEVSYLSVDFPERSVKGLMFRAGDGKIHQLQLLLP